MKSAKIFLLLILVSLLVACGRSSDGRGKTIINNSQNEKVGNNQEENSSFEQDNLIHSKTVSESDDVVMYRTNKGNYKFNMSTKTSEPYLGPLDKISKFTGLPREMKNKKISVSITQTLLSQDKKKAIVVFTTFDETKAPSEFDGSLPALKADEFVCDIVAQKCSATDFFASAYDATDLGGNWYGQGVLWWKKWDSEKNLIYGHLSGEGVGNASPVYVFDFNNKSLRQTTGYNSLNDKEKRAGVPSGSFSPSLNKFVMVDKNSDSFYLLLYQTSNLTEPFKKYDISAIKDKAVYGAENGVDSVAWSTDEKTLVLETHRQIFTLDLTIGEISLKYTDESQDTSGLWFDFNAVDLSPSGRYIVFVDWLTSVNILAGGESKLETVLKAIDLKDNNKEIELVNGDDLTLYYQ